jgi:hypothetical protein
VPSRRVHRDPRWALIFPESSGAQAVAYYYEKERLAALKPTPDWYPASIFFQGMTFMLFGDPALRLPR